MSGTKTLRGNATIWAVRPEAIVDWTAPISLAAWGAAITAGFVTDISQAVEDGYKLNRTGSATDSSEAVTDLAPIETPLYSQYEASLDIFRNTPGSVDTLVYDVAMSLFDAPDVKYYLVKRLDKTQGAALAVGDILSAYGVITDIPEDLINDGGVLQFGARFKPTGISTPSKTVVA
jgi:hypothetical protein